MSVFEMKIDIFAGSFFGPSFFVAGKLYPEYLTTHETF